MPFCYLKKEILSKSSWILSHVSGLLKLFLHMIYSFLRMTMIKMATIMTSSNSSSNSM